jgi:SOS-response transcriptional repressor LexA
MVMVGMLEVWILDGERVIVVVVARTKEVVVVKTVEELVAKTEETSDDAIASGAPIHPTNTPRVVFIGTAKHPAPLAQTDITNAPPNPSVSSQCPTFPSIQAIPPILHTELKSNVAKSLLYAAASATFALKIAGETVPVAGGADVMAVGAGAVIGRPVETSGIPGV